MVREDHASAPGLGVWVALLITACSIAAFAVALPSKENAELRQLSSWLQQQASNRRHALEVVVLGSSLTGCGLDSAAKLQDTLQQQCGRPVQVTKIWELNAGPQMFAQLSPELHQLQPSVVVIEANMLFYSFKKNAGWPKYVQRLRDFLISNRFSYLPDSKPVIVHRTIQELASFRTGVTDTTELTAFGQLLSQWHARGTKIILFNYPLESTLEKMKWSNADTAAFYRNLGYLNRYSPMDLHGQPLLLDETNFIDHAHMNQKGERLQSALFCRLVTRELQPS